MNEFSEDIMAIVSKPSSQWTDEERAKIVNLTTAQRMRLKAVRGPKPVDA